MRRTSARVMGARPEYLDSLNPAQLQGEISGSARFTLGLTLNDAPRTLFSCVA
jgi:hypothetical protein